jgi:hypothetical protein
VSFYYYLTVATCVIFVLLLLRYGGDLSTVGG